MLYSPLSCRINLSNKQLRTCHSRSGLSAIWDKSSKDSSCPTSPFCQSQTFDVYPGCYDVIELMSSSSNKERKRNVLSVPPRAFLPVKKEFVQEKFTFIYTNITFSYKEEIEVPEFMREYVIYAFEGEEHKLESWGHFKQSISRVKYAYIKGGNFCFYIENNKIKVKALSETANTRLKSLTDNPPYISEDNAIELINDLCKTEIMTIYSSSPFHYSVVRPVVIKTEKRLDRKEYRYITKYIGCMFPDVIDRVSSLYGDKESLKIAKIAL